MYVIILLLTCLHYMAMFAIITCMATKHDKTALADALAGLAETHPDLAEQLGSDPSRADLLAAIEEIAPDAAAGLRQVPRAGLVATLAAIALRKKEEEGEKKEQLEEFTTRLPKSVAAAVRARAFARGCSIQALVAEYLRAGLAADEPSE